MVAIHPKEGCLERDSLSNHETVRMGVCVVVPVGL